MKLLKSIFNKTENPSKDDIQAYLDNKLDRNKTRKVEEALSDNPFLGDAIDGYKEFGSKEVNSLPEFDTFYSNKSSHAKIRGIRPAVNKIAAAMIGVMMVGSVYLYWNETSYERIYSKNFGEFYDPSIYASRGRSDNSGKEEWHPEKEKAINLFQESNYGKSIIHWKNYLEVNPEDVQSMLYLGYSYLEEGQPEEALGYLMAIAGIDTEYKDETRWYLALAQIRTQDMDGAKITLDDLVDNAHEFYAEKAKSVLENL
jgi:tetratricopeptide (TPR) repeat protein